MEKLQELVDRFDYNLKQYKSGSFNETNTRQQFIDKFFGVLGWDVNNNAWYSEKFKEVVLEDRLKVQGKTKAPDYSFRLGGRRIFFVEAKKPSVNIKEDTEPAFQIRRYSWTAKLPLGILTDFEELAIYDTRIKPNQKDKAGTARTFYCEFKDYKENRNFIYDTFSKEAVQKGSMDKYIEEWNRKWTSTVDKEFLQMISSRREALAKSIWRKNKIQDMSILNHYVQTIIDRIIFLRIAEDRNIENYWTLQGFTKENTRSKLLQYFDRANDKYNSGLFSSNNFFKQLIIDDKTIKIIINSLYYPICPYEFFVLGVDILGSIYEQFLGKEIVKSGRTIITEYKPDVKKAWGVYYTPQYIVVALIDADMQQWVQLDSWIIKKIISWENIKGRALYKDPITFSPYTKLLLATNDLPRLKSADQSIKRRFVFLHLKNSFIWREDYWLKDRLKKEKEEIFIRAIQWLKRLLARWHFQIPKELQDDLTSFIKENDSVEQFLESWSVVQWGELFISNKILYNSYSWFCKENWYKPLSLIKLWRRLVNKWYRKYTTWKDRWFKGMGWEEF